MPRIDTSEWQWFRIGDLFEVSKGSRLTKGHMKPGNIPFIGASAVNNGITAYVGNSEALHPAGSITVSYNGSIGAAYFQTETFWASDDVNILMPKEPVEPIALMFVLPVLKTVGNRYAFSDKWRLEVMVDDQIPLPATAAGQPDWQFMECYMSSVLQSTQESLDMLTNAKTRSTPINSTSWRKFEIGELFVIKKGTRLTRANMKPGEIPFIGASLKNNGITAYISNSEHVHPGGTITVAYNGQKATGKAFWQTKSFWASDDVNVLYPKFELTEEIALYLQPLIWEAGRPYSFGDKWSREVMESTQLTLPVTNDGEPDWDSMASCMTSVLKRTGRALDQLEEMS